MIPPENIDSGLALRIDELTDRLEVASRDQRGTLPDPELTLLRTSLLSDHLGRPPVLSAEPLHCVGDSHTMFFAGARRIVFIRAARIGWLRARWINRGVDVLPCFKTWHLGPATAYRAARAGSTTRTREKIDLLLARRIPAGSHVLLSFGEIDCRVHLPRLVKEGADLGKVTAGTVDAFMRLPRLLRERGFKPAVWGPPTVVPHDEKLDVGDFPFVGPWELRRDITLAYIEALDAACRAEDIPAVSLANDWHDLSSKPPIELLPDGIHLSQALMPLALDRLQAAGVLAL